MMTSKSTKTKTNWKKVALELGQRVNFAITHLRSAGSDAQMVDLNTMTTRHWKDYMADGLEQIPGLKVDRELMHASYRERKKILFERERVRLMKQKQRKAA